MAGMGLLTAAAQTHTTKIAPLQGEKWWGGLVALGDKMPFAKDTPWYDMSRNNRNNQIVPLMLSSEGRYLWSDYPFRFQMRNDTLVVESDYEKVEPTKVGTTLREAYRGAAEAHFPPTGKLPEEIFFSKPQYNTWIELMYNQNQADIEKYAEEVMKHNFPTGIFMIDDNWQKYYGNFDFKPEKFPDPKGMIERLHADGFKVMVWVCPFVSPDSPEYRLLRKKGFLIKEKKSGQPAMIRWWNGVSACYDMTNPEAVDYLTQQLKGAQEKYGIDGFKFDAGDVAYMNGDFLFHDEGTNVCDFSMKWAEMGLRFPYNELRTSFKLGAQPLVQRLGDKAYSWGSSQLLIPDMVAAGLLGHLYTCPDMIGGGEFSSFLNVDAAHFDQELIVRSCQIHAFMPMMQFSVAPWRILDREHLEICARYARFHEEMGDYILSVARESARSGEPMVRSMEYAFPHRGFIGCSDQFMLGDRYMVAPMVTRGYERTVRLPRGVWKDDEGRKFRGPKTIRIEVPIGRLPYFERIK